MQPKKMHRPVPLDVREEMQIVSVLCVEREGKVLATTVGIVVVRNTTRLDVVKLEPIADKVLQSRKTVQGPCDGTNRDPSKYPVPNS